MSKQATGVLWFPDFLAAATSLDGITTESIHCTPTPPQLAAITMKAAARLLANVKAGKFLEPGAPTGLTGLVTHPSPRSTLLYHYHATLDKLQKIPESSVYRQSTEALTRHRLKIIEESKPKGWDQWMEHIQMKIHDDPEAFRFVQTSGGTNIIAPRNQDVDDRLKIAEWDGEAVNNFPEGIRSAAQRRPYVERMKGDKDYKPERKMYRIKIDPEPQYTEEAYVYFDSANDKN